MTIGNSRMTTSRMPMTSISREALFKISRHGTGRDPSFWGAVAVMSTPLHRLALSVIFRGEALTRHIFYLPVWSAHLLDKQTFVMAVHGKLIMLVPPRVSKQLTDGRCYTTQPRRIPDCKSRESEVLMRKTHMQTEKSRC